MDKRTKKMLLAILMIIMVLAADFFVLGQGIITYASELSNETNNTNVEFLAYFKDGENRVDSIQRSIKDENVNLYAEIKVKTEGYLTEGTVIDLENSNFSIKNEILESNTHIKSIEGNKVNLKQINAGDTVEIELGIEPIIAEKITQDFLSKVSKVKMIGTYIYSKDEDGMPITADKLVSVDYQPDETINPEFSVDLITNKIFSINGTNKRIVQVLVKSRLTNNEYPVEKTIISAPIPVLSEETPVVSAMAISELATNGKKQIDDIITENGKVQITLNNNSDENNEVSWRKNIYDEIVITYIYSEAVDVTNIIEEIGATIKIKALNSNQEYVESIIKNSAMGTVVPEPNNVIIGRTEITTEEIYKGNLYANLEIIYNTKTSIAITNADVQEEVIVREGEDVFKTIESELEANTKYISTEINLENMLEILGPEGNIEIKNGDVVIPINKETTTNGIGNVVINYKEATENLYITTSRPISEGILELKHTKAILPGNYTRAQLQNVKSLNTKGSVNGTITVNNEKQNVILNDIQSSGLELKETTTKAELTIENNKTSLSTTEANELTLGITLVTNGTQYDLFKNPQMNFKFPEAVKNVELLSEANKQNADEFTVNVGTFDETNKTMTIKLNGEQKTYTESELTQGYIQLNLRVTLESLALTQTDKITMTYTNENASQYENEVDGVGIVEKIVQISAPSQLVKRYNLNTNENTSLTETITQRVKNSEAGKTLEFQISLKNNKDSALSNLKILGKLPTTGITISGQNENTLETTLKGITAENATIYYTENTSVTLDVNDAKGGWTQDLTTLTNAKQYMIIVDSLERGTEYIAKVNIQLPDSITTSEISYTQYGVVYDTATETEVKEVSRKIGLLTSEAANINMQISAQVGQDILEHGDVVKEGEVIKYTIKVKNNGTQTLENIQLKLDVPEGTTYVRPYNDYVYEEEYYEEIKDADQLTELTTITLAKLNAKDLYEVEYEVRINKGTANTDITNTSKVFYDETQVANVEFKNKIQEGNVRISISRADDLSVQWYPGKSASFMVYIENLTNLDIRNLDLQLITNSFEIEVIENMEMTIKGEELKEKMPINEIKAKERIYLFIRGKIKENVNNVEIMAVIYDEQSNAFRSNRVEEFLPMISATMNVTSPQNKGYIKNGDIVEYNVLAKNTGEIEEGIRVEAQLSDVLKVESIAVNGEIRKQTTDATKTETYRDVISNTIYEEKLVAPNKTVEFKIIARVGYIPENFDGNIITNKFKMIVMNNEEQISEPITHILKSTDEEIENVISGFVWLDLDGNGQKDENENTLNNIEVKLFDVTENSYAKDKDGILIRTITKGNGEYIFKNVKNGSYLVIFEHDAEQYEPTKFLVDGVEDSLNSKAILKYIKINNEAEIVTVIKLDELNGNMFNMNLGLKENTGEMIPEPLPEEPEKPGTPEKPTEPEDPTTPEKPDEPGTSEKPKDPEKPEEIRPIETKTLGGYAWLDENENNQKESTEKYLSGIKVRLYDISTKDFLTDEKGKIVEKITDAQGKYKFENIKKGLYIVIFEYDTEEYETIGNNSSIVAKKIKIDGEEILVGVTDVINLQENISNIKLALKENLKFDLELNKYISKIVVQTSKEAKTYEYKEDTLGKVEIHRKQIQGANVVLEYTIKVKNSGEIAGTARNIVDYVPNGLTFSSELNKDWYLSGDKLYTKALDKEELKPGEEKIVKLILTKAMTNNNMGLINNRAEIYEDYNKFGESDIDSTPNNQAQNEDDFGTTDVIIQVATGGNTTIYITLAIVNIVLIYMAIKIMIKNEIIEIKTKEERR